MKFKKSCLIIIAFLASTISLINAQNNSIAIRTNAGIASSSKIVNGYYYSFEIGISFAKYFEIAPIFIGASMTPQTFVSFYWNDAGVTSNGTPVGGPQKEKVHAETFNSVGLLFYFKPLKLFKSYNSSNRELLLGFGLTYDTFTRTNANYKIKNGEYGLTSFGQKLNTGLGFIYGKVSYNIHFNKKAFYGIVASFNDFDGDDAVFLGLQLGAKL